MASSFHMLLERSASPSSSKHTLSSRWLLKKKGCLGGNSFTQEKYATVQCCPQLSGLPNLVLVVQCPHCIILVRFQMFRFRSAMLDHLNTCTQESGQ
ncbi:hypothetical protein PVAP13_4KG101102 [Panicum virgatum]|uniref:Uncharacterized protein n=1 Tax=Panicum virgatum TaxID=38727 RepID=A0A8T0TJ58_PANVG|nr:hypothetical protein PVAP13_4KG101102 [Panicum virgatum]